jgi:hypothetical protein
MIVHRVILVSAVVGLLLVIGQSSAQAPPPVSETEQRLKAVEAKMDRVLKLLEPRTPALSPLDITEKHMELMKQAVDTLVHKFESVQKEYQDFRMRSPISRNGVSINLITQQTSKDEAALQVLRQREAEVIARSALVKNVGDVDKEARALLVLLQRRGVDVELLRRTAGTRRDEEISAVELVRLYGASLRQEAEELQQLIQTAEERIEKDRRTLREMKAYEVAEESLRATRDNTQRLLDVIVAQLSKIDVMREMAKPK